MSRRSWLRVVLGVLSAVAFASPAAACGPDTDCAVTDAAGAEVGSYRIRTPSAGAEEGSPVGAVLFLHGWRSSAQAMMRNERLEAMAESLGVALVTPQGAGNTWSHPGSPAAFRDEFAYFDALRATLAERGDIDMERLLLSGFSQGASMVWFEACRAGDAYAAAAPMAGAFWNPIPSQCPSPARFFWHLHGEADTVVPIEGRPIGDFFRQSDADLSFELVRGSIAPPNAWTRTPLVDDAGYACESWTTERRGAAYDHRFCRHDGGHVWRTAWIEAVWAAAPGLGGAASAR